MPYISVGKEKNKYSRYAHLVYISTDNKGLMLSYKSEPKVGLVEKLTELKNQKLIFDFDIEKTAIYYNVRLEIGLENDAENLTQARDITDSYFDGKD